MNIPVYNIMTSFKRQLSEIKYKKLIFFTSSSYTGSSMETGLFLKRYT